ncbi:SDR family NAD(P)-dependent oxidoreductase, partial [Streptomyces albidoflavus]|uniref:SDR family NAD(P)-dependent oxidoreductase n=1 Tax=Streptomyces albidoflavus TaxID=1886 RepID=UPI00211BA46B
MRHVLVTGAAGGIGRAIATRFAAQGATLTLADRERAPLDDFAAHLPMSPRHIRPSRRSQEGRARGCAQQETTNN